MGTAELRMLNTTEPDEGVSGLERGSERMAQRPERGLVLRLLRETA